MSRAKPPRGDAALVEWRTMPESEQRRVLARGLRRIANRLHTGRGNAIPLDAYRPLMDAPATPEQTAAVQEWAAQAQVDAEFLQSVAAYIADLYNGTGRLTSV